MRPVAALSLSVAVLVVVVVVVGCIYVPPPGQTPFAIATLAPPTVGPPRTLMPPVTAVPATVRPVVSAPPLATAGTAPTRSGIGSRENPYAVGAEFAIGDWRVAIESVEVDAWDVIRRENQFNNPPAAGRQYVMFGVAATYDGTETGTAWLDLRFKVVGADGNTFGGSMDDYCGVIPSPLNNAGEQFPGSTVQGNECIAVDSDQLGGATLSVEAGFLSDERIFIALH